LNQPSPEYTETVEGKTEMNIMSEAATEKAVDAAIEESAIKMRGDRRQRLLRRKAGAV
jgi:hypothetical protein